MFSQKKKHFSSQISDYYFIGIFQEKKWIQCKYVISKTSTYMYGTYLYTHKKYCVSKETVCKVDQMQQVVKVVVVSADWLFML